MGGLRGETNNVVEEFSILPVLLSDIGAREIDRIYFHCENFSFIHFMNFMRLFFDEEEMNEDYKKIIIVFYINTYLSSYLIISHIYNTILVKNHSIYIF